MKRLVVVESPTKARTLRRFLPKEKYRIEASMGHVRDLPASAAEIPAEDKDQPWARLGVQADNGFEPLYIIPADKKKVVRELKDALKDADELYIATDEDREGESIGWHLLQVLNPKVPVRRMVFHEITREAILEALDHTRSIDRNLVNAQEARRVLDRLVGYTISPLLWKKIAPKLSAGRVQSVAVRLMVLREKERLVFVPASFWNLKAHLEEKKKGFEATMTHYQGLRLATGRDFDDPHRPRSSSGGSIAGESRASTRSADGWALHGLPSGRLGAIPECCSAARRERSRGTSATYPLQGRSPGVPHAQGEGRPRRPPRQPR